MTCEVNKKEIFNFQRTGQDRNGPALFVSLNLNRLLWGGYHTLPVLHGRRKLGKCQTAREEKSCPGATLIPCRTLESLHLGVFMGISEKHRQGEGLPNIRPDPK